MAATKIRLGTRASQLALWQSNWVREKLESLDVEVELIKISTSGDQQTGSLSQIGGQGLFTKRIQEALLDNEIDLAVHSLKDLPTEDHPDLLIAAIPKREVRTDALVTTNAIRFDELPQGAIVGTGSVRRAAQLLFLRPDLKIKDIRGNVDTRLRKLDDGEYDAIVLAAAGLTRLGWADRITYHFSVNEMMPAVGQGALGLETRWKDRHTFTIVRQLNHDESYFAAIAERAMLKRLYAGCLAPVGANCQIDSGQLTLEGAVLSRDGRKKINATTSGEPETANSIGTEVAEALLRKGADALIGRTGNSSDQNIASNSDIPPQ